MKIQTRAASGSVLNWMVAKAIGYADDEISGTWNYSENWTLSWSIIERSRIGTSFEGFDSEDSALMIWNAHQYGKNLILQGSSILEAALRCYVANQLGLEVDVPDSLVNPISGK